MQAPYIALIAWFIGLLITSSMVLVAQNNQTTPPAQQEEATPAPENKQLYLEKVAHTIKSVKYKESGEPLKGELSKDGMRVFIRNYTHRARVVVELGYADGTEESIERSPCFIDPAEEM